MIDKQKITRMTSDFQNFVRNFQNIYILPETFGISIISLIKHFKSNFVAFVANTPNVQQNTINTPSGKYPFIGFSTLLQNLNRQTAIIVSSLRPVENFVQSIRMEVPNTVIDIPAFVMTDEEATTIYDRIIITEILNQYQNDNAIIGGVQDISMRFARGISTFFDSQFQDVKVQVFDRRQFKIFSYEIEDTAIVIQGPLEYRDNYTITTAKLYRQWYPNAPLIISTWKNQATNAFREECRKISAVILENELPNEPGGSNLNYQLESSFKGVNYVKNNTQAKFVLKCRTDQRINRVDFLIYFKNLLKAFPPKDSKINSRIILLGWSKWWPFFLNDFLYFGDIEDMNKLFGIPRQTLEQKYSLRKGHNIHKIFIFNRFNPNLKFKNLRKLRNFNKMMSNGFRFSEIFILTSFHEKNIGAIDDEKFLQTYWKFLRDYLIIADEQNILLDWPKYHGHNVFNGAYNAKCYYDRGIDHARWLDIYLNYKDEDD